MAITVPEVNSSAIHAAAARRTEAPAPRHALSSCTVGARLYCQYASSTQNSDRHHGRPDDGPGVLGVVEAEEPEHDDHEDGTHGPSTISTAERGLHPAAGEDAQVEQREPHEHGDEPEVAPREVERLVHGHRGGALRAGSAARWPARAGAAGRPATANRSTAVSKAGVRARARWTRPGRPPPYVLAVRGSTSSSCVTVTSSTVEGQQRGHPARP